MRTTGEPCMALRDRQKNEAVVLRRAVLEGQAHVVDWPAIDKLLITIGAVADAHANATAASETVDQLLAAVLDKPARKAHTKKATRSGLVEKLPARWRLTSDGLRRLRALHGQ